MLAKNKSQTDICYRTASGSERDKDLNAEAVEMSLESMAACAFDGTGISVPLITGRGSVTDQRTAQCIR
jgi:hypothetical protein